jgi:hypothetical protein
MKTLKAFFLTIIFLFPLSTTSVFAQTGIPSYADFLIEQDGVRVFIVSEKASQNSTMYLVSVYFLNTTSDIVRIENVKFSGSGYTLTPGILNPHNVYKHLNLAFTFIPSTVKLTVINISQQQRNAAAKAQQAEINKQAQLEQQKKERKEAEQKQEQIDANSATINFKVDVGARIIADGYDLGICTPNVLYPVKFEKTGPNVQHLIQVIPLASASDKKEQIMVLQPGSSLIKQFTFLPKLAALENKRVTNARIENEKATKLATESRKKYAYKWEFTNWNGKPVYGRDLILNIDGTGSSNTSKKLEISDRFFSYHEKWNVIGNELILHNDYAESNPYDKYIIEDIGPRKISLTTKDGVVLVLRRDPVEGEVVELSDQLVKSFVGKWPVTGNIGQDGFFYSDTFIDSKGEYELQEGNIAIHRQAVCRRSVNKNKWDFVTTKEWKLLSENQIQIGDKTFMVVDGKYLLDYTSSTIYHLFYQKQ